MKARQARWGKATSLKPGEQCGFRECVEIGQGGVLLIEGPEAGEWVWVCDLCPTHLDADNFNTFEEFKVDLKADPYFRLQTLLAEDLRES